MKKIIILLCSIIVGMCASAQTDSEIKSKSVIFSTKPDVLLKKEFRPHGTVKGEYNNAKFELVLMTDLKTNKKMAAVRVETFSMSGSSSGLGFIDYDEIADCIQCLKTIKSKQGQAAPKLYTEYQYKTRDGVIVGAYYSLKNSEWTVYMDSDGGHSEYFDASSIDELIYTLEKGLEIVKKAMGIN